MRPVSKESGNRTAMGGVVYACLKQLVPLIVEYSHVQKAIEFVKSEAIRHLVEDKGMSADEAGAVLDRSGRWVYSQRNGHSGPARRDADKAAAGYSLQMAVLEFFARRTPDSASIVDCLEALDTAWPELDDRKVVNLIDAFCKLGYLERSRSGYRWVEIDHRVLDSSQLTTRLERVANVFPETFAIQLRYLHDDVAKIKRLGASIKRSLYAPVCAKMTRALNEVLYQAVLDSDALDEQGTSDEDAELSGFLLVDLKSGHRTQ